MKLTDSLAMRIAPWAIPALILSTFILDLLTPLGLAVWLLYAFPLALSSISVRDRDPIYVSAVVTVLVGIGFFASPGGLEPSFVAANRIIGVGLLWAFAVTIIAWRRSHLHEAQLMQALSAEQVERAHAEGLMQAAQEARTYADTALMGAAAGRQAAESSLVANQLRMEGLIQSAMDAIITVDQEQKVVLFNRAAEQMFGCSAVEAMGRSIDRFMPRRFRHAHHDHVQNFGKSGVTSRKMGALGTISGLRANGEEFPLEAAISHVSVDGAKFYTVILRDISERVETDTALRQSEDRLNHAVQVADLGIFEHDHRTDQVYWSAKMRDIYGLTAEAQASLQGYLDMIHPDDRDSITAAVQRAHDPKGDGNFSVEHRLVRRDGTVRWVSFQSRTSFEGEGAARRPLRTLGAMVDVTERKLAETGLAESEERYRKLIEVSPDAIFLLRGDRIELANARALALLGAKEEREVVGRSCYEFLTPESEPLVRDRFHQLAEGAEHVPVVEEQLRRLDGSLVDVEVTSSRLRDGGSLAIQSVMRDITERKRLQEHLRRTERLAELGTLASGMAHEIGTPMNVIMGRAEHLMQRTSDEKTKKGLQIIVTQVERITKIMNQLLSMARRRPGERRPVDLRRIIDDCLEVLQERFKRHHVQVVKDYEPRAGPATVDSDQMSQVLLNLFLNADHAMAEGGTLRIGLRSHKGQVALTVGDTGHGIPEDILPKIFTPFFTTKEVGKGTGLGLSVVHGIIEEHRGTISVHSEVGKGTTFTITLPGAKAEGK